ncbi:hypothetical protein GCM10009560_09230 [Nonomuraea longicatena]|uniref:Uncharacterized protein n=1 Tax=Nonomuraea longicatena TaxID=83682 RepID=A0ABN1NRA5_9ACTN
MRQHAAGVESCGLVAEALRSGVNSVGQGQGEAARALGLTFTQSLRLGRW